MATIQEYCEKLSTEKLEVVIFDGMDEYPKDIIVMACEVLLARDPDRWDVRKVLWHFIDEE